MSIGWLVNDCLTCIPNTKTFWHDLLENIDGLQDKTFGYTGFDKLPSKIERELFWNNKPDYIIRNATFFRPLKTSVPQICLLQDFYNEQHFKTEQLPVINSCEMTVINSPYIYNLVKDFIKDKNVKIIPMGVDFEFFNPELAIGDIDVLPNSILFIGAATEWPKGFDLLMKVVESTGYNFTFVMKDDFVIDHPRIKVFNRIDQIKLRLIMKQCKMSLCTSKMETFHLAGVESCAMNLPVVTTQVGIYTTLNDGGWGLKCDESNIIQKINYVFNNTEKFQPREALLDLQLDKKACMKSWNEAIKEINNTCKKRKVSIIDSIIDTLKN